MNKKLLLSLIFALIAAVASAGFIYYKYNSKGVDNGKAGTPAVEMTPEQLAAAKISAEYNMISGAIMTGKSEECEKIETASVKNECYMQIAVGRGNPALCEKIAAPEVVNHCKEQIIFNKIYENNKDIKNCKQFNATDLRRMCYAKIYAAWDSESKCNELEEEYRADCRNQVRRRAAFAAKDPDKCKTLTGDAYQEECRKSIENLPKDSDGDGLNDSLEMSIATDPNKRDTDGDGVGDMQEILKKTDPKDRKSR